MVAKLPYAHIHYASISADTPKGDVVVLFLHEALGSIGQWKNFPSQLCEKLNLPGIIYERQGHGKSGPLKGKRTSSYLHEYAWEELPEFLRTINETRRLLLVGHSDGGTIALLFASRYPEKVAGICTMAAHVINEPETIVGIAPAVKAYTDGKLSRLEKYHGDKTETLFYAWADIWRHESFRNWDITEEIGGCNANGLFLQGANDQYGTEKQLKLIVDNFSGTCSSVLLKDCRHHPHLEQTNKVIEIIQSWYESTQSFSCESHK